MHLVVARCPWSLPVLTCVLCCGMMVVRCCVVMVVLCCVVMVRDAHTSYSTFWDSLGGMGATVGALQWAGFAVFLVCLRNTIFLMITSH